MYGQMLTMYFLKSFILVCFNSLFCFYIGTTLYNGFNQINKQYYLLDDLFVIILIANKMRAQWWSSRPIG